MLGDDIAGYAQHFNNIHYERDRISITRLLVMN